MNDRTLEEKVMGMRRFYADIQELAPHYNITQVDALSVYAKILVQAAIYFGDSKEEMLRDLSAIYDYEKMLTTEPKDAH